MVDADYERSASYGKAESLSWMANRDEGINGSSRLIIAFLHEGLCIGVVLVAYGALAQMTTCCEA